MEYDPAFPTEDNDEDISDHIIDVTAIPLPVSKKKNRRQSKLMKIPLPVEKNEIVKPIVETSNSPPQEPDTSWLLPTSTQAPLKFNILKPNTIKQTDEENSFFEDLEVKVEPAKAPKLLPKKSKPMTLPTGVIVKNADFVVNEPKTSVELFLPPKITSTESNSISNMNMDVSNLSYVNSTNPNMIAALNNPNMINSYPLMNMSYIIPQKLRSAQMISQPLVANPAIASLSQKKAHESSLKTENRKRSRSSSRGRKHSRSKSPKSGGRSSKKSKSKSPKPKLDQSSVDEKSQSKKESSQRKSSRSRSGSHPAESGDKREARSTSKDKDTQSNQKPNRQYSPSRSISPNRSRRSTSRDIKPGSLTKHRRSGSRASISQSRSRNEHNNHRHDRAAALPHKYQQQQSRGSGQRQRSTSRSRRSPNQQTRSRRDSDSRGRRSNSPHWGFANRYRRSPSQNRHRNHANYQQSPPRGRQNHKPNNNNNNNNGNNNNNNNNNRMKSFNRTNRSRSRKRSMSPARRRSGSDRWQRNQSDDAPVADQWERESSLDTGGNNRPKDCWAAESESGSQASPLRAVTELCDLEPLAAVKEAPVVEEIATTVSEATTDIVEEIVTTVSEATADIVEEIVTTVSEATADIVEEIVTTVSEATTDIVEEKIIVSSSNIDQSCSMKLLDKNGDATVSSTVDETKPDYFSDFPDIDKDSGGFVMDEDEEEAEAKIPNQATVRRMSRSLSPKKSKTDKNPKQGVPEKRERRSRSIKAKKNEYSPGNVGRRSLSRRSGTSERGWGEPARSSPDHKKSEWGQWDAEPDSQLGRQRNESRGYRNFSRSPSPNWGNPRGKEPPNRNRGRPPPPQYAMDHRRSSSNNNSDDFRNRRWMMGKRVERECKNSRRDRSRSGYYEKEKRKPNRDRRSHYQQQQEDFDNSSIDSNRRDDRARKTHRKSRRQDDDDDEYDDMEWKNRYSKRDMDYGRNFESTNRKQSNIVPSKSKRNPELGNRQRNQSSSCDSRTYRAGGKSKQKSKKSTKDHYNASQYSDSDRRTAAVKKKVKSKNRAPQSDDSDSESQSSSVESKVRKEHRKKVGNKDKKSRPKNHGSNSDARGWDRNDSADTSNSSMNSTSIPACYQAVKKNKKKQKHISSSDSESSAKIFKRKQKSKKMRKT